MQARQQAPSWLQVPSLAVPRKAASARQHAQESMPSCKIAREGMRVRESASRRSRQQALSFFASALPHETAQARQREQGISSKAASEAVRVRGYGRIETCLIRRSFSCARRVSAASMR